MRVRLAIYRESASACRRLILALAAYSTNMFLRMVANYENVLWTHGSSVRIVPPVFYRDDERIAVLR